MFGKDVSYLIEEPSSETSAVAAAFDGTRVDSSEQEQTFTAIRTALLRYLPIARQHGYKLILFVVTDEAGDDSELIDGLVADVRRDGVPIYVAGTAAPLGRVDVGRGPGQKPTAARPNGDWIPRRYGPESRYLEFVDFQSIITTQELRVIHSGFGPFALEWLCRASSGAFLAIRPKAVPGYVGIMGDAWPSRYARRFPREAMRNYAPDYLSEEDYQALLSNAAARALHEAAKWKSPAVLQAPQLEFIKRDEGQLAGDLTNAQRLAASIEPSLDQAYELLKEGEIDRERLTSRRWQAAYDLAFGRAAVGKVRARGYNGMLARLKRGMSFQNPASKVWVLEPADEQVDSSLQKIGQRGREYLERVVREHPNTPWAAIAQQDLETPSGWRWTER
jgi:hypothetical protein